MLSCGASPSRSVARGDRIVLQLSFEIMTVPLASCSSSVGSARDSSVRTGQARSETADRDPGGVRIRSQHKAADHDILLGQDETRVLMFASSLSSAELRSYTSIRPTPVVRRRP